MTEVWQRVLNDAEATAAMGAALARVLHGEPGGVVFLEGDLGAGKTTLARGLLRAIGVRGAIRSPTYTLVEPYDLPDRRLLHMDLYRLQHPDELEQLGLADQPPEHWLWLVEWPQRGTGFLPPADLRIHLQTQGDGRCVQLTLLTDEPRRRERLRQHLNAEFEIAP